MTDEFNMDAFLDALDELENYGRGEGGLIGKFKFEVAFFIFSGEVGADEKYYPFDPANADAREKAREDALDTLAENDVEPSQGVGPHVAYITTFYKDTAKGATAERAINWQGDRTFALPVWSDGAKEVYRPAIKELGLKPGEYWGRISFREDPGGRTEQGLDGETRVKLVAFPAELYASEAEAEEAVGSAVEGTNSGVPSKFHAAIKQQYDGSRAAGKSRLEALEDLVEDWEPVEEGWAKNEAEALSVLKSIVK